MHGRPESKPFGFEAAMTCPMIVIELFFLMGDKSHDKSAEIARAPRMEEPVLHEVIDHIELWS